MSRGEALVSLERTVRPALAAALVTVLPVLLPVMARGAGAGVNEPEPVADELRLDLRSAISLAHEHNFAIRRARHRLASSQSTLITALNDFDFKLDSFLTQQYDYDRNVRSDRQDGSFDDQRLSVFLRKDVRWGGSFRIDAALDRRRTLGDSDILDHDATYGVSYTHPLWGQRGRRYATAGLVDAELGYLGEARSLAEQDARLVVDVTRGFYAVARTRSFIDINQSAADRAKDRLAKTRLRLEEGLITPIEVARSERELNVRRNAVIAARESWANARDDLLLLLGLPLSTTFRVEAEVEFQPVEVDLDSAIAEALAGRFDLRNQRNAVELAELSEHVARQNRLPQLDITIGADWDNFRPGEAYREPEKFFDVSSRDTWSASLTMRHVFGDRSDDEALVRAMIATEQARLSLEEREREIEREVRVAVRNVQALERQVDVLRQGVDLARESSRLAHLQYDEGLISTVDLFDDQDQLVQAEIDYVNALYDHAVARVNLDLVLARYHEPEVERSSEFLRDGPAPSVERAPTRRRWGRRIERRRPEPDQAKTSPPETNR